jgi:hypothetical protein
MATPANVRRFEALSLASIILGLIHAFAVSIGGHANAILTAFVMGALVLLASRGRRNWARWTLLVIFGLGSALMVWQARAVFSNGYPLLTAAVTLLQAVAIFLLFTPQSTVWFRKMRPRP